MHLCLQMEVGFEEEPGRNRTHGAYNLTGLQASAEYEVALRCVAQGSAFWSGWSPVRSGATEEEGKCPDPLGPSACRGGWSGTGNPPPGAFPLCRVSQPQAKPVQGVRCRRSVLSRRQEPAQWVLGKV